MAVTEGPVLARLDDATERSYLALADLGDSRLRGLDRFGRRVHGTRRMYDWAA